jgi:hypothetical protein
MAFGRYPQILNDSSDSYEVFRMLENDPYFQSLIDEKPGKRRKIRERICAQCFIEAGYRSPIDGACFCGEQCHAMYHPAWEPVSMRLP